MLETDELIYPQNKFEKQYYAIKKEGIIFIRKGGYTALYHKCKEEKERILLKEKNVEELTKLQIKHFKKDKWNSN